MKRIASILTGLSLAVLSFVTSAHAQYDGRKIVADIPFEFIVGSTSLPAGQYDFLRTEPQVFQVRDASGRSLLTLVASTEPSLLHKNSGLTFATVDGQHVLVQIWDDVAGVGYDLKSGQSYVAQAENLAIDGTGDNRR